MTGKRGIGSRWKGEDKKAGKETENGGREKEMGEQTRQIRG